MVVAVLHAPSFRQLIRRPVTAGAGPGERAVSPGLIQSPEELTPEWLTRALRFAGATEQARVVSVELDAVGKGKTGSLFRVRPQYRQAESGAPASLIAKFPGQPGAVRDLVARFGLYEREVHFYCSLAVRAGVRSPRAFVAAVDDTGRTLLLLEDIANAAEGDLARGASLRQAGTALEHLAAMHARWWDNHELDTLSWLPARNNPQTKAVIDAVPARAWVDFVKRNSAWLSPSAAELVRRLAGDRSVLERLSRPPLTLVHGDTRINNMMFSGEDGARLEAVVDWQSVMRARPGVDVACLLVNSLTPAERRSAEANLLPMYLRALHGGGVEGYSLEQLWMDYRLEILNELNQVVVWSSLGLGAGGDTTAVTRLFAAVDELELLELLPASDGTGSWRSRFGLGRRRPAFR